MKVGIPRVLWQTLIHTAPLVDACSNIATVKKLIGHSSIGVTMRCAHTNIESKRAAVEKLDSLGLGLVTVGPRMHQSRAILSRKRVASYNIQSS